MLQKVIEGNADKETKQIKTEISPNSDKKDQKSEQKTDQNSFYQPDNKDNKSRNIYYGIGVVSLVLLLTSMIVVWMKKKRQLNKKLGGS